MSQTKTTSPKLLWGDMVDDDEFEKEHAGKDKFIYNDLRGDKDEKPQTPPISSEEPSVKEKAQDSPPPPDEDREQIYYLTNQLHIMKSRLQKNSLFLSQVSDERATAEYYVHAYWQQIQEMQTALEKERQLRLAREDELSQCKGVIAYLQQSPKTSEAESDELKNLKNQLQEKTSYIHQLTSELRAQKQATQDLEQKVAELSEKVPDVTNVSKVDAITQTEEFSSEKVSEPKDQKQTAQTEASETEGVSELLPINEEELVSKPEEMPGQETKKKRRRRRKKTQESELPTNNDDPKINKDVPVNIECKMKEEVPPLQDGIPKQDLLIPCSAVQTDVSKAEEVVASNKKKKRNNMKS